MYLNPFVQRVSFRSDADSDRLLTRLKERAQPVEDNGGFLESLRPRGAFRGRFADNRFEIDEAMFGFGGARARGAVVRDGKGSVLSATLRPGAVMRYAAPFMATVVALGAWIVVKAAMMGEPPPKLLAAFLVEIGLFASVWAMALHEMRPIRLFLQDTAGQDAAPL